MSEPEVAPIPSENWGIDKRFLKLKHHDVLMKPPFTAVILGAIGAGKTSLGYSLMNSHYANYFDEVLVICGTLDSKKYWEEIKQRTVVFVDSLDDAALERYVKGIEKDKEERIEKGKYPLRCAMVLDDCVFDGMNKNRQGMLEKLMMTCRHYNISILLMLQHSKMISAAMRNQIFYWFLFRVTTNDLEKISAEHAERLTDKDFQKMYHNVQGSGKHEFMLIDYKAPVEARYRHRFTKTLNINDYLHKP